VAPQPSSRTVEPGATTGATEIGFWVTGAVSSTSEVSALLWFTQRLTLVTVPPELRLLLPIRTCTPLGTSPAMQCSAVSTHVGRIRAPPQKWPPELPCIEAMKP
jgi:hypothetical protein